MRRTQLLALLLGALTARAAAAGPRETALPAATAPVPAGLAPITLPDFRAALLGHVADLQAMPPREGIFELEKLALAPLTAPAARTASAQLALQAVASPSFSAARPGTPEEAALAGLIGAGAVAELRDEVERVHSAALEDEPLAASLSRLRALLLPESRFGAESWTAVARRLSGLFDGKTAPSSADPRPEPLASEEPAGPPTLQRLPADVEAQVLSLASLGEPALEALGRRLESLPVGALDALPMPGDTTFSLELEFLVSRQLDARTLERLLGPGALDEAERRTWALRRELPQEKWQKAHEGLMGELEAAMPRGWRLTHESLKLDSNTMEIKTANGEGVYHENTPGDWAALEAGLAAAQSRLPGGLFSVHVHASRSSALVKPAGGRVARSADQLAANAPRAAKAILMFEPYWRALYGVPWPTEAQLAQWSLQQPYGALAPDGGSLALEVVTTHGLFANLSLKHPTVEVRLISGLIDGSRPNGRALDAATLKTDLWPALALARLMLDAETPLPLAALPLPSFDGPPTAKALARFLDLAYASDPAGKALALPKLLAWRRSASAPRPHDSFRRKAALEQAYHDAGLGVVHALHAEHGGYDERLKQHLEADGGALLARLGEDLSRQTMSRHDMAALFPEALQETVLEAVRAARRRRR
jgi:hypothetical protein